MATFMDLYKILTAKEMVYQTGATRVPGGQDGLRGTPRQTPTVKGFGRKYSNPG